MATTGTAVRQEEQTLKIINWRDALNDAVLDPAVNIKIAVLGGDSTMMMGVTELQPGAKINAHVHAHDAEVYFILNGNGEMYIGYQEGIKVRWNTPVMVKEGDVFTVEPGMVHQLKNISDSDPLTLMFSSPWSHLKGDRVVAQDYDSSNQS